MIPLLHLLILAATQVVPGPYQPPTWENLIPWMFGFFALIVSSLLFYFTNTHSKKLEDVVTEIKSLAEKIDKMSDAIYLAHRARLVQMAADPNIHAALKEQCEIMVREIDQSTAQHK